MNVSISSNDTPAGRDGADSDANVITNSSPRLGEFHLFSRLPPEIRHQIYQEAMLQPAIVFIGICPCICEKFHVHQLKPKDGIWKPAWEQWYDIANVNQEAAEVVELTTKRADDRFPFDTYSLYLVDLDETLVTVHLVAGRAGRAVLGGWEQFLANRDPDVAYNSVGVGVKRVGFWWKPEEHRCSGHGNSFSEFSDDPWRHHLQQYNEGHGLWFCSPRGGLCFDMMRRYIAYFRDAKTIYFLAHMVSADVRSKVHKDVKRGVLQHVANKIVRSQRAKNLERWEDYSWTWYEVDMEDAESLFAHRSLYPWHTARALGLFLKTMDPKLKAQINPEMQFKVLSTGHHMQRARTAGAN